MCGRRPLSFNFTVRKICVLAQAPSERHSGSSLRMGSQSFLWVLPLYFVDRYNRISDATEIARLCDLVAGVWCLQSALMHLAQPEFESFHSRLAQQVVP